MTAYFPAFADGDMSVAAYVPGSELDYGRWKYNNNI